MNFLTAGMFAKLCGSIDGDFVKLATNLVPFPPINMVFPKISGLYSVNRHLSRCTTDLFASNLDQPNEFRVNVERRQISSKVNNGKDVS